MRTALITLLFLILPPAWADESELQTYAFPPRNDQTREGIRTDALLIIQDGRIVFEHYSAPTNTDTPHLTWSISKSVLATVLGVAYGEGRFKLDDPAAKFYPPMQAHPQVRIQDLLHWASGLDWQEDYEYAPLKSSVVAMLYTSGRDDMAGFTAAHGVAAAPGQRFLYSCGDSNVLSAALRQMVGAEAYANYPWQALFEPLGIRHAVWERDAQGTFVGSSYLYMTARELAQIGQLMLDDGRWQGRQLLPAEWVKFNRQPFDSPVEPGEAMPGGHWWLNHANAWPDAPADTFAALGHWGQALYVIPRQRLVIVRYADDRDGSFQHNTLLRHVVAAFPGERP
ncbi:serine hydrolase domain-containing protein [Pseudomonas wadenswilerensis]